MYEPELTAVLARIVEPGWSCADVGAHVGHLTEALLTLVGPAGHVTAFEPHPANVDALRRACAGRPVTVVASAVGDGSTSTLPLHAGRNDSSFEWNVVGHDVTGRPTPAAFDVPAVSLDEWFREGPKLDLVKIDVEGAEADVLAGMERILATDRPVIAVEFHDETGWAGRRTLLAAGYELRTLGGDPVDLDGPPVYQVIATP